MKGGESAGFKLVVLAVTPFSVEQMDRTKMEKKL